MPSSNHPSTRSKPSSLEAAERVVADVACLGCGCLCDDIAIGVRDGQIVAAENACPLGIDWFMGPNAAAESGALVDGRAVTLDEAIDRAAELLAAAKYPLVTGLSGATCQCNCASRQPSPIDWEAASIRPPAGRTDPRWSPCNTPARSPPRWARSPIAAIWLSFGGPILSNRSRDTASAIACRRKECSCHAAGPIEPAWWSTCAGPKRRPRPICFSKSNPAPISKPSRSFARSCAVWRSMATWPIR